MNRLTASLFAAIALAGLLGGCASVQVSDKGRDMVVVQNSGCFLFGCIPLFSGDPNYPNEEVCNWFENTVKVKTNIRLLEEEAERRKASGYRNLASHKDVENVFWIILKRKIYRTSAELVR